ncbi:MAG TPA: hypothetical protein VGM90_09015 [Kofleriaceae bacterium]
MRGLYLYIALLPACQGSAATPAPTAGSATPKAAEAPRKPVLVEVKDSAGKLVARVAPSTPCEVTVDGLSLDVDQRLAADNGPIKYSSEVTNGDLTLLKDGQAFARIGEPNQNELALFDDQGIASIRVAVSGGDAVVRDRAGSPVRELRRSGTSIIISSSAGDMTVTGTSDLLLAAVLTATEASPEVRALAACHRMQKAAA